MSTPTPHISAKPGDFAKTVLMPGDPLRAKYVAENFLENAVLVNQGKRHKRIHGNLPGKKSFRNGQRHGYALHGNLFL